MTAGPGRTGERAIVHHGIERIAEFRPALQSSHCYKMSEFPSVLIEKFI